MLSTLFKKKDDEYITLKDGYNIPLIIGITITIIATIVLCTTKLWLPDSRNKMTLDVANEKTFKDTVVQIDKEFLWNKDTQVAQIKFDELCLSETDENIKVVVKIDKEREMPLTLIKGVSIPEEQDSIVTKTNYILQFGMPKDTYYALFEMSKGQMSYKFMIDYRDFKIKPIKELKENYLIELNNHEKGIADLTNQKVALENELVEIQKLSAEEQTTQQARIDEINVSIQKLDIDIKNHNHEINVLKQGI